MVANDELYTKNGLNFSFSPVFNNLKTISTSFLTVYAIKLKKKKNFGLWLTQHDIDPTSSYTESGLFETKKKIRKVFRRIFLHRVKNGKK